MQPNITVMVAFKNQKNPPISSIKFDDETLAWAANENSKKRFKSNFNLWTLQASLKWSKKTINKYKNNNSIMNQLISRFIKLTGFEKNKVIHKKIHGWKYSYNYKKTPFLSNWDKKYQLGICGDWFDGPKVENAWISANDLAKKIKYTSGLSKTMTFVDERVLKEESVQEVTRMLVKVVDEALLGGAVKLDNYSVAAKTGTAQIADLKEGGYYEDKFLHSFFGYFPAYDAQYLVFLYTIEPKEVRYASQTLTHPFIDTVKFLINYYEVPPDR